jgi:hypothetical protein
MKFKKLCLIVRYCNIKDTANGWGTIAHPNLLPPPLTPPPLNHPWQYRLKLFDIGINDPETRKI